MLRIILWLAVLISPASAHSWYPWECCNTMDCYPVPVAREHIERREDGWFLKKERITIPFDAARVSPDRHFHLCRDEMGKGKLIIPHAKPPCLWAPQADN